MIPHRRIPTLVAIVGLAVALSGGIALAADGAIRGKVLDIDFGSPLGEARVSVVGTRLAATTGEDGNFLIERVPPGAYTLVVSKGGYDREVLTGIVVTPGELAEIFVELSSEVFEMAEMVVTGVDLLGNSEVGLLSLRMESTAAVDAISEELFGKSGASDAAGVLQLVVGTSIVDGKYATVRGMSDRYTGTTLNGVRVPSADPRRRAVQVDLFPAATIESVTVSKTFTPDQQGDFTGGGIDIRTKSIPDGPLLSVKLSGEYNSNATGNDGFLTYRGGGISTAGLGAHLPSLPAIARQPLPPFPTFSFNPNQAQIDASAAYDSLVRAFEPTMGVTTRTPGLNFGTGVTAANRYAFGDGKVLGLMGSVTYSRKYDDYSGAINNTGAISDPTQGIDISRARVDSEGTEELTSGVLGNIVLQLDPQHELSLKYVRNESIEDSARYQFEPTGANSEEQNQALRYVERNVTSLQLLGNHKFGRGIASAEPIGLNWLLANNFTTQDEPDVRFFRSVFDFDSMSGSLPLNSTEPQNTRRIYRAIDEDDLQFGLDLSVPFTQWSDSSGKLKAGLFSQSSDREYDQTSFSYRFPNQFGGFFDPAVTLNKSYAGFLAEEPGQIWTDVFLEPERIGLAGNRCVPGMTSPPGCAAPNQLLWSLIPLGDDVSYTGDQTIQALYSMVELPLTPWLKLTAGARHETTEIDIDPFNVAFGLVDVIEILPSGDRQIVTVPQEEGAAKIDESSLLPALSLLVEVMENMNLRASWSETIARPTFRELAPVATEEFLFGDEFIGNPDLLLSEIVNYDLRWEWFRRPGEVLAASAFRKELTDPIELISFSAGGRNFIQPFNFPSGEVTGFEFEARTALDNLSRRLAGVSVGANYTLIDSEVDIPQSEQLALSSYDLDEPTRRLQGQPDYLLNANVTLDKPASGLSLGLFYNVVGELLVTGAATGLSDGNPNVFRQPFHSLDASIEKSIKRVEGLSLSLRGKNLLQDDRQDLYRAPGGKQEVKVDRETALKLSLSASMSW